MNVFIFNFRFSIWLVVALLLAGVRTFGQEKNPTAASQGEVNNGVITTKYVSPGTLAGRLGGTNGVVSVATLGGTNDDTLAFSKAFNSGKPVICPVGDFNVTNIVITNDNEYIVGYGCRLHMGSNAIGYTVSARYLTNIVIQGLSVYGGIYQHPGWTFSSGITGPIMNAYYFTSPGDGTSSGNGTPTNARSGYFINTCGRSVFSDLYAEGYNVSGYMFCNSNNSGAMYAPLAKTENLRAAWCLIGFNLWNNHTMDFTTNNTQYLWFDGSGLVQGSGTPDYLDLESPMAQFCSVGIANSVWNLKVNGAECSSNYMDFFNTGEYHGSVIGGHFNHDVACAVYCCGAQYNNDDGASFVGVTTEGGAELWYLCKDAGMNIVGCRIGGPITATNESGIVAFSSCYTNAASGGFTSDGTGLVMLNCLNPRETNSSLIPITGTFTGNGSGLTNLYVPVQDFIQINNFTGFTILPFDNATRGVLWTNSIGAESYWNGQRFAAAAIVNPLLTNLFLTANFIGTNGPGWTATLTGQIKVTTNNPFGTWLGNSINAVISGTGTNNAQAAITFPVPQGVLTNAAAIEDYLYNASAAGAGQTNLWLHGSVKLNN